MDQISRKEAKALGLNRYYTGKPCKHGHIDQRKVRNGECLECLRTYSKAYHAQVRQERPELAAKWRHTNYENHKEAWATRGKKWADQSRDKISVKNKRWRNDNKERFVEMVKDWRHRNPANVRMSKYKRRALLAEAGGSFTNEDLDKLMWEQGQCCAGCDESLLEDCTIDHKLPVSRGGSSDPSNLQLLCRGCNSSKGTMTDEEWRAKRAAEPDAPPLLQEEAINGPGESQTDRRIGASY